MIESISSHLPIFWLVLGVIFIFIETLAVPGIGFLFVGLASLTLGGLLTFNIIETTHFLTQLGYVALLTFIWGVLLWKPFKKYINRSNEKNYSNIVGEMAMVATPTLNKHHKGQITWSGTTMSALLEQEATVDEVPKGTAVYIVKLTGTTAIVSILSS